jgi:hypothetical protein
MNTTVKAKDASAEMATRNRYAKIAVTAVRSRDTSGLVMTFVRVVSAWPRSNTLAKSKKQRGKKGKHNCEA